MKRISETNCFIYTYSKVGLKSKGGTAMDGFSADWLFFVITGLGTLFLLGELLVNMKGLFGLLGIGFITVYFLSFLDPRMYFIMLAVYLIGLLLIIIDGKILNDGTLAVTGFVLMILSVALSSPDWVAGLYAIIGIVTGAFSSLLFLKVFKHRKMWTKLALADRLTEDKGYNSMNSEFKNLVGKEAIALTDMRPIGTIKMNDKQYSAISNGQWIKKDTPVTITKVDGTKIMVEKYLNE